MLRYARIQTGVVAEPPFELPEGVEPEQVFGSNAPGAYVLCLDEAVGEGWAYDGVAFAAPAPLPPPPPPTAAELSIHAADRRYAVETGGITVNGAPIATDRVSQAMIGNAYAYVQASGAASVSYKTAAGFVTLTADQVKAVALAVGAHVQACFKAEDDVDAAINASPPTLTTVAEIDAAFAMAAPAVLPA